MVYTATELAASIDEVWDLTALEARYETGTLMQKVLNKSDLVKKSGVAISMARFISRQPCAFAYCGRVPLGVQCCQ